MSTDELLSHDLLQQCEQVATFVQALRRVACQYAWLDVEPYAEEAWSQISDSALTWPEIREFVREAWIG
ncbi:hypothetical protein LF41_512 [Lysobacter dokdonensis DS-58]|uniref:Uncharacterized protein n=1 Tax=Lysobacter dokdonensis DS-58 TaxID=1300345 RepID=A0A0A2WIE7_9GAMM|nr:hypothetical protein LF41_512 [Lysobacter dokdonensis DS-58]